MMNQIIPDYVPGDYNRIKVVGSMSQFFNERFGPQNVILYPRAVVGDFRALARWIDHEFQIEKKKAQWIFNSQTLNRLYDRMLGAEQFALRQILNDMDVVSRLQCSAKDSSSAVVLVVMSSAGYADSDFTTATMHHDTHRPGARMGRTLCCYTGPVTEWVRNEDAKLRFCGDFMYDLKQDAAIQTFRLGDIWRSAGCNIAEDQTLPFIHRSRKQKPGNVPRLILRAE
jgi:hypothetical protein